VCAVVSFGASRQQHDRQMALLAALKQAGGGGGTSIRVERLLASQWTDTVAGGLALFEHDDQFVPPEGEGGMVSLAVAATVLRDLAKHHVRFLGAVPAQLLPL
jgi:hypothetical protein